MDSLDVDMALAIRERLGARDLARSAAVCRSFCVLANHDVLWRGLGSRETHDLVGQNELPGGVRSNAKRLYVCNRAWTAGEFRRSEHDKYNKHNTHFVDLEFGKPVVPGKIDSSFKRKWASDTQHAHPPHHTWSLRGVHTSGVVVANCDTPTSGETKSLWEVEGIFKTSSPKAESLSSHATCATFMNRDDPNVAVSGFHDGTARLSSCELFQTYTKRRERERRPSWETKEGDETTQGDEKQAPLVYPFAFKADGAISSMCALPPGADLDGEDGQVVVAFVEKSKHKRSCSDDSDSSGSGNAERNDARGVLLTVRVPSGTPKRCEENETGGGGGFGQALSVRRGGWCVPHSRVTSLRAGGDDGKNGVGVFFAGTASGSMEQYDLGNGQPRVVGSFVGPCTCHVVEIGHVFDNQVVATYRHPTPTPSGHAGGFVVFDIRSGDRIAVVDHPKRGRGFVPSLHVDSRKVVLAQDDGLTHVFDKRTWSEVSTFQLGRIGVTSDGKRTTQSLSVRGCLRARGDRVAAQVLRYPSNGHPWYDFVTGTVGAY